MQVLLPFRMIMSNQARQSWGAGPDAMEAALARPAYGTLRSTYAARGWRALKRG